MTAMQWVMVMIVVVLVTEILSGWHKGIYRRHDLLVTGGCMLFSQLTRPLSAMLYAGLFAFALPDYRAGLSGAPFWPSAVVLLPIAAIACYWAHRMAHNPRTAPISMRLRPPHYP